MLERGRVHDPAVFAQAARRAAQLSSIDNDSRAARAITQYQGTLAIVARAASRRSITPERLAELVSSLSAIEPAEDGDYEGALVRWLEAHIVHTAGAWEADLLRLVAGPAPPEPRIVAWEGTRYRADPAYGETVPHITPARRGCTPLRLVGSRTRRAGRHAEGGGVACRRDPAQCRASVSRGSGCRVGGAWRLDRRCGGALRHRLPGARSGGTWGRHQRRSTARPSVARARGRSSRARPARADLCDCIGSARACVGDRRGRCQTPHVRPACGHTPACVGIARYHDRPSPRLRRNRFVAGP